MGEADKANLAALNAAWKALKKSAPLPELLSFLHRSDVIVAFGSTRVANLILNVNRRIEKEKHRVELAAPSAAWMTDALFEGQKFPPPLDRNAVSMAELRADTAMVRSEAAVRYGLGLARPRWTPPQAVGLEDELDQLTYEEARYYQAPPSCSAVMLQAIRHLHGPSDWRREVGRAAPRDRRRGRQVKPRRAVVVTVTPQGVGTQAWERIGFA